MVKHYLILALRTLWRNKFHAALNVTGLAMGISSCLVIYLIVTHELSFNKAIPDADRIYRIHSSFLGPFSGLNRGVPTGSWQHVRDNFKGVESATLFFCFGSHVIIPAETERKKISDQQKAIITDPSFFETFPMYEWIAGTPEVLNRPHTVVLTEKQFRYYYGDTPLVQAIGKEVIYRDSLSVFIGGIVKDLAFNTDMIFTDFISIPTLESSWLKKNYALNDWNSVSSSTQLFVKREPNVTTEELRGQLPALAEQYTLHSQFASLNGVTNWFKLQPLSDLHYDTETGIFDFSGPGAHRPALLALIGVALLLLLIGAINFINLETAQAIRRAKEVGVRKVLGSTRIRLVMQFLCEGLLLTCFAILLALPLTEIALTTYSDFVPKNVSLTLPAFLPFLLGILVVIGVLASAYPAIVLSSFLPVTALKNQINALNAQSRSAYLRRVLIVFQFAIAQVLIIGTLVVGWQTRYILSKDLGFEKDAIVYLYTPRWEKQDKVKMLKGKIESIAEVSDISLSDDVPSSTNWSSSTTKYYDGKDEISTNVFQKFGDTNYVKFYSIKLLAGRHLQESDTVREFLINDTFRKQLGFQQPIEAIGQMIEYSGNKLPIVGVVEDFHIQSLHKAVEPVMIANTTASFDCLNIKFGSPNKDREALQRGLKKLEAAWKEVYPDAPFNYHFLDDTIRNFYITEKRTQKLAATATGLAIFISCLGLFGLASYTTTQRTKEIGVRKVLGASVRQIVFLLSKDFIALVIVAFVIALPVAWLLVSQWLNGFPYRTEISWWIFGIAVIASIAIAFLTVSHQTFQAANRNPVETLRNE